MVFKCQNDSFLKEFESHVTSCEEAKIAVDTTSKTYEIILGDTILFPEGGGQPCDYGYLNNLPVQKVVRRGDKAVHFTEEPIPIGTLVHQKLNWSRRFDHMQQHSGQHLITAIIDREFGFPTVSWWLGEEVSYIELDAPQITNDQIKNVEEKINELIRQGKKVTVDIYSENTPEEELIEARSARGLPDDHKGDIRIIRIEDVEGNMCCGTHVTNLSQLQVVKLLHSEKSKRKGKIFLYFLVGNRVLNRLTGCIEREQKLTTILKNNPTEHFDLVTKLQNNVKSLTKDRQTLLKDVAILEAKNILRMSQPPLFISLHRKEASPDFMNIFIRELSDQRGILLMFLSTGDEKKEGNIVLYGIEKIVADLGPKVSELLNGKGAGSGKRFQAKVLKMSNRQEAEKIIREYIDAYVNENS